MPPKKRQRKEEADADTEGLSPRDALVQIDDVVGDLLAHLQQQEGKTGNVVDVHKVQQGLLTLKAIQNSLWHDMETTQKALDERKAAREKVQQQLQGLAYEADCLQAEIKVCREFETTYLQKAATDEKAASITDFLQADPNDPANKHVIVGKLQTEINARGTLQRDLQAKQKTLATLQDELKRKKAFLQSLPHHVSTIERASSGLQKTMFTSNETKTKELRWNGTDRRARLKVAQQLCLPLFTLYSSLQNYIDCVVREEEDNHKRMALTVHAKPATSTDTDDNNNSLQHQSVSWTIPIPDPVVASGRPKKITIQFQYANDGNVTAVVSGGASTLCTPTTVLQDLFSTSTDEKKDSATAANSVEETTALSWCNYLAGLHLPEPHVHSASVRSIVRVLCRRLRANAILKIILTALSRKQVPNPPVDAKMDDIAIDHKCQLVSCTTLSTTPQTPSAVNVYELTLRQASRRLTVHVEVHHTRYPEVSPKWKLNLKQEESPEQPPVFDERLAAVERLVNIDLLQNMQSAPEVAQEWLLVHQLHTIMNAWEDE
jgi:hypothetical protein